MAYSRWVKPKNTWIKNTALTQSEATLTPCLLQNHLVRSRYLYCAKLELISKISTLKQNATKWSFFVLVRNAGIEHGDFALVHVGLLLNFVLNSKLCTNQF